MLDNRQKRAKMNIIVSLCCQILTVACGLITPRLMLGAYGSEAYGMCSSITQFLGYIALLEGGIGGVARAALYKPLAENNTKEMSAIVCEIKRFFRIVAYIFVIYVLIIACSFKYISKTEYMDYTSTFLLVLAISISTFGQYFVGISYAVFLQAAQRVYITNLLSISLTVMNTIAMVMLISLGSNLIQVKLLSSCIYLIKPIILWIYVKRKYKLNSKEKTEKKYLTQKWSGLSQHIAYFLHSNTDVVVLTLFSNLTSVAIYSVYNMVSSSITNLTMSFTSGMEAVFGDMLSKNEKKELDDSFEKYEMIISIVTVLLFSITSVLIVPFVRIYTMDIKDANYITPVFAILLVFSAALYCFRLPYHAVVVAAGHFKQTQWAAYGEALINIGLSIILVRKFDLIGVAVATVIATGFRFVYYVQYLSNNILFRKKKIFLKRMMVNIFIFIVNFVLSEKFVSLFLIENYFQWFFVAFPTAVIVGVITIGCTCLLFPKLRDEGLQFLKM